MKISVIGSGQIGSVIASLLCKDPEIDAVALIDHNGNALTDAVEKLNSKKIKAHKIEIEHYDDLSTILAQTDCIISALPPHLNRKITKLALKLGKHYVDLGGSDITLDQQLALHEEAVQKKCWLVPYAGFAPGLANILAMQAANELDETESITIYGGGLPIHPEPPFYFQMNFSPIGLVKEYVEPATVIRNGKLIKVDALSDYEEISIPVEGKQIELEAFVVSGRISSLARLLNGKISNLSYKVLRYKGHKNLLDVFGSLGFLSNNLIDVRTNTTFQDLFIRQLTKYLPKGNPDFVLARIEAKGLIKGTRKTICYSFEEMFKNKYEHTALAHCSAISAIVTSKLLINGALAGQGGASAPEGIIPYQSFIDELSKFDLHIKREEF
jgi:lysine 6-dehydrogenase